jgi:hypothetical protein
MRSYGPLPQPLKPCAGGPNSAFCLGGRVKCQKDRFGAGGNRGRVEAAEGHVRANAILRDCIAIDPFANRCPPKIQGHSPRNKVLAGPTVGTSRQLHRVANAD